MIVREETMSSEIVYNGKIVNLRIDTVELPKQRYSKREIVEHPGGVGIIALTEENEVIMVRQFRKPIEDCVLEIPAGKLDNGEDPKKCAIRELKEETGYEAENMEFLLDFYSSPGFTDEKIHIYFATGLKNGKAQPDENEYIEIEKYKIEDLVQMIKDNEIHDAKSIISILYVDKLL
ncbi:ADP-ribose pyrophosphatase [Peptoclostridium litorale DSM 5388]|uniref:ADP-ribose pyrophosphatase NudF n=1 Tax=Peptoclostridium litorale DSM 5388 TaxID=1121324 RepID=A0A069RD51_PEPLI|nr:NUDIX hydrolase [Peptoclostridium litorale]KDR94140.1 ADP-ribose pyrophosphatase NudF [Peptoclostridium litorale DSM 5388]SIN81370.1 ADP-ribose pyrophosphatase [Peptoclostridium litorale DSM 5388]